MVRVARVALTSVLMLALSASAWASAFSGAHLDASRVFSASSSLSFTADPSAPLERSSVADVLFNLPTSSRVAADIAELLPRPAAFVASGGVLAAPPTVAVSMLVPTVQSVRPALRALHRVAYVPAVSALPAPSAAVAAASGGALDAIRRAGLVSPSFAYVANPVHFGTYEPYVPTAESMTANISVPVRVGSVHFAGTLEGRHAQTQRPDAFRALQLCGTTDAAAPCPYLSQSTADAVTAGTRFNIAAGHDRVALSLSGTVEQLTSANSATFQYVPVNPDPQIDGEHGESSAIQNPVLYYPGLTGMVTHGVNASVAVPVSRQLTVGLQYDSRHYQGEYATDFLPGVDAHKDTYLGNLTYQLPNTSSAITLSARQYRYQNTIAPDSGITQTRADLDFTVKF